MIKNFSFVLILATTLIIESNLNILISDSSNSRAEIISFNPTSNNIVEKQVLAVNIDQTIKNIFETIDLLSFTCCLLLFVVKMFYFSLI